MSFIKNEAGAVTVDWVVLTAALVGMALAVMAVVSGGVEDLSGDIDGQLKEDFIIRTGFGCQSGEPGCTFWIPETNVDCSGPNVPQDCGVNFFPWIAGTYTNSEGAQFSVNSDNVAIDPDNGDLLPLNQMECVQGQPNCVSGIFDAAGREVDINGVPV